MSLDQSTKARRQNLFTVSSNGIPRGTKEISPAPMLERAKPGLDPKQDLTFPRAVGPAGVMIRSALPAFMSWAVTMSLIIGGCCSNVFTLEAIVKEEPESGLLITFTQFIVTFLFTWPSHFSRSRPPWFLKAPAVPLIRWLPNIVLFYSVNMLNNFAFGYQISVPVHIILRSGGSVTTMLVGWICGKCYNRTQVFSVTVLTFGVIIAAMADAQSKGKFSSSSSETSTTSFVTGLGILFVAQVLSALMGLYTQSTYALYGPHWNENLFYSHFLSLPLFVPFLPSFLTQYRRLLAAPALEVPIAPRELFSPGPQRSILRMSNFVPASLTCSEKPVQSLLKIRIPIHLVSLLLNSLTQYACIRGVNLLGARTSALGVTIVLNVRKLISLFVSIYLFGNDLPLGVMLGAAVVFTGGGIYAWEGSRRQKKLIKAIRTV